VVLDQDDSDFGSGGVLLLPPQSGASSNLAVAAGKVGIMYVLNADNLRNGAAAVTGSAIETHGIGGGCWCVASYYTASDGLGRIVSSGGANAIIWKVTGGATPALTRIATSQGVQGNQDAGFFTSVSSNGTKAGSVVIWAVGRPAGGSNDVRLYAAPPAVGHASEACGTIAAEGVVHASTLLHAKDSSALWAPDH
jgi:hypothetical protein